MPFSLEDFTIEESDAHTICGVNGSGVNGSSPGVVGRSGRPIGVRCEADGWDGSPTASRNTGGWQKRQRISSGSLLGD